MDQELNRRLSAIEEKIDENHRIIVKIRKMQRNAALFRLGYWVLLILVGLGAFYFIKPFVEQVGQTYGFGTSGDFSNFSNALNQFQFIEGE